MGLQLVAVAARAGARGAGGRRSCAERRRLAARVRRRDGRRRDEWADGGAVDPARRVAILSIGAASLRRGAASDVLEPGGRLVLFAGFGDRPGATLDLNRIHYRELAVVGSEWIGTPPNVRPERYAEAARAARGGRRCRSSAW